MLLASPSSVLTLLSSHSSHPWILPSFQPPITASEPSRRPRRSIAISLCIPNEKGLTFALIPFSLLPTRPSLTLCCSSAIAESIALNSTETHQELEQRSGFIEVGYISNVHGIRGELRVKPTTDFPELRFSKPGRRWLRKRVLGKEVTSEVELIGGRCHSGRKSWIVSLSGIDTADKAKQMVGSTLLVEEGDRPELDEDEFYTSDLVGMSVVLKESGRLVGTVVNVFNTGASDLLQVMLYSTVERFDRSSSNPEISPSGSLVWIPFVEAIVPNVDMDQRKMQITPPKGLLELNLRSDIRSKKERRMLEWNQKKKLQQRLIAAKRKMCEVGQQHLLEAVGFGKKDQKSLLANQIVDINFKLLKHALLSVNMPSGRYKFSEYLNANSAEFLKNSLNLSHECFISCSSELKNDINYELHKEGYDLLKKSKAAIVLVMNDDNNQSWCSEPDGVHDRRPESKILQFENLLLGCKRLLKVEEQRISIPIVLVSSAPEIQPYEQLLLDKEYLGFDIRKVLAEEQLPMVSTFTEENTNKILFKSPWEILQAPTGSGGVFNLLSSQKIVDSFNEQGVDYVQVCSLSDRSAVGHPLFFGLVKSHCADVGIKIFEGDARDDEFDMIFSMRYLNKISNQIDKIDFYAVPEEHVHVELVGKEWIPVHPEAANSIRFRSSIYSSLKTCSPDKMCMIQIS